MKMQENFDEDSFQYMLYIRKHYIIYQKLSILLENNMSI